MKKNLNSKAKLAYYVSRSRKGDLDKLSSNTGYSKSHISNVIAGRRKAPEAMVNEMYKISNRRAKNSELVKVLTALY